MGDVIHYLELRSRGLTKGNKFSRCKKSVKNLLEDVAAQPVHNHPCEFSGEPRATFLMDFSPNMLRVASTHGDHTVRVTDIRTGKCTHILTGHPRTPWCLAFNPASDEILASGCLAGQVRIWDLMGGGSETLENPCIGQVITSLAFHPTGNALVFATMNYIYFWDWSQPKPFTKAQTSHDNEWVRWLKFDPLGHYLYTGIANYSNSPRESGASTREHSTSSAENSVPEGPDSQHRARYQRLLQRFMTIQQDRRAPDYLYPDPPRSPVLQEGLDSAREYADFVTQAAMNARQRAREYVEGVRGSSLPRSLLNPVRSDTSSWWANRFPLSTSSSSVSSATQSYSTASDAAMPRRRSGVFNLHNSGQQEEPPFPRRWGRYDGPSFFSRGNRRNSGSGDSSSSDSGNYNNEPGNSSRSSNTLRNRGSRRPRNYLPSYVTESTSPRESTRVCRAETYSLSPSLYRLSRHMQETARRAQTRLDPNEFEIVPVEDRERGESRSSSNVRDDESVSGTSSRSSDFHHQRDELQSLFNRFVNRWHERMSHTASRTSTVSSSEEEASTSSVAVTSYSTPVSVPAVSSEREATRVTSVSQPISIAQTTGQTGVSSVTTPGNPQNPHSQLLPPISVSTSFASATRSAAQRLTLYFDNANSREQETSSAMQRHSQGPSGSRTANRGVSMDPYMPGSGQTWRRGLALQNRPSLGLQAGLLYRHHHHHHHHHMSSLQDRITPRPVTDQTSQTLGAMNLPERSDRGTDVTGLGDSQSNTASFACYDLCDGEEEMPAEDGTRAYSGQTILKQLPGLSGPSYSDSSAPSSRDYMPSTASLPMISSLRASLSTSTPPSTASLPMISSLRASLSTSSSSPPACSHSAFQDSVAGTHFSTPAHASASSGNTTSTFSGQTPSSVIDSSVTMTDPLNSFLSGGLGTSDNNRYQLDSSSHNVSLSEQSQDITSHGSILRSSLSSRETLPSEDEPSSSHNCPHLRTSRESLTGRRSVSEFCRLRHLTDTREPSAFSVFSTTNREHGENPSHFRTSSSLLSSGTTSLSSASSYPPHSGSQHQPGSQSSSLDLRPAERLERIQQRRSFREIQLSLREAVQQIHDVQSSVQELSSTTTTPPAVARQDSFTEYLERRVLELDRRISSLEESYNTQLLELNRGSSHYRRPMSSGEREASYSIASSSASASHDVPPRVPPRSMILIGPQPGAGGDAGAAMSTLPDDSIQHDGGGDGPSRPNRQLLECLSRPSSSQSSQPQSSSRLSRVEPPASVTIHQAREDADGNVGVGPSPRFRSLWLNAHPNYLHPDYSMNILDNYINFPDRDVHRRLAEGAIGAIARDDHAVATNLLPQTYRIQQWDVSKDVIPDIKDATANIVVENCKLRNAASCDLSKDGSLLATIVPGQLGFVDNIIAVFSVRSATFAQCLYTKKYGPDAISLSISPGNRYLMVGLAAQRFIFYSANHLVAEIYKLVKEKAGENSMAQVTTLYHYCDDESRATISANSARWLPGIGEGIIYGTNRGDLNFCRPGSRKVLERESPKQLLTSGNAWQGVSRSARRNVATNNIATQTTTVSIRRSASTQTLEEGTNPQSPTTNV